MKRYKLRTDLIVDNPKLNGKTVNYDGVSVTSVKSNGNYITIMLNDVNVSKCEKILSNEIKKMLEINNINDMDDCLVIGLGNRMSTADSLGPLVIDNVKVTRHLFEIGKVNNIRSICSFCPSVMGNTGIESANIIKALIDTVKPKFIIAIDSLASSSIDNINKIIQVTDTGIHPGSGVGNNRKEISKKTIGIPVIAIGVPTVVSSSVIARDTFDYMIKHLSYIKDNMNTSKLSVRKFDNYKDKIKNRVLDDSLLNNLAGIIGMMNENDRYNLFSEVLDSINENMIVTSTDIDFIIKKLSLLISNSLNSALYRQIS